MLAKVFIIWITTINLIHQIVYKDIYTLELKDPGVFLSFRTYVILPPLLKNRNYTRMKYRRYYVSHFLYTLRVLISIVISK